MTAADAAYTSPTGEVAVAALVRRVAPWAALSGLVIEGFGATWDIAWHGDIGRDRFLTPPHVTIVCGIAIVLVSAAAGCARSTRDAPGLAVAGLAAILQLAGLAIDNWWHGIFGVDVTLWSPPHLLLLALGYVAFVGLLAERAQQPARRPASLALWSGGFLGATTLLLAEYDFGFPHFALLWSPLVLAGCMGVGFGLARATSGWRWAGTAAAGMALAFRAATMLLNAAVHRSIPIPPLGIAAGGLGFDLACVFAIDRRLSARSEPRSRPRWGLAGGLAWFACFPAQAAWLHLAGKTWWPATTLLPGLVLGALAAAGGTIGGAFVGRHLGHRPMELAAVGETGRPGSRTGRLAAALGVAAIAALVAVAVASYQPVATSSVGVSFTGNGGVSATFVRSSLVARPGGFSLIDRRAELWVSGAGPGDWVSVFRLDSGGRAGWTWIGGLTWRGAGRFTGTLRRSVDGGSTRPLVDAAATGYRGAVPLQVQQVGLWLVHGNSAWAGVAWVINGRGGPGIPGVVLAESGVHWVGGRPPAGPASSPRAPINQVALFRAASTALRPPSGWLTPVAYVLVLAVLIVAVVLGVLLLGRPPAAGDAR